MHKYHTSLLGFFFAPDEGGGAAGGASEPTATQATGAEATSAEAPPTSGDPWVDHIEALRAADVAPQDPATETTEPPATAAAPDEPTPGPVPYERFREVNDKAKRADELEQQLASLTAYQDWLGPVARLAEIGATPEELLALLEAGPEAQAPSAPVAPAPAPEVPEDPTEALHQWMESQGIYDPYGLAETDPARYEAAQARFELDQLRTQLQTERATLAAQQAEATRQESIAQQRAAFERDMAAVQEANPILKKPALATAVRGVFAATGRPVAEIAAELVGDLQSTVQAAQADYAAAKAHDARVPVVSGGASVPPVERVDFHNLSLTQQQEHLESYLESLQG